MTLQLRGKAAADIIAWTQAAADLAKAKVSEMTLRLALVGRFFKGAAVGTHREDLGRGYQLKCEIKQRFRVKAEKARIADAKLRKLGPAGKLVADRLFNWLVEIRVGEYHKLTEEQRAIVDECLTIEPATPSLELVEPKA